MSWDLCMPNECSHTELSMLHVHTCFGISASGSSCHYLGDHEEGGILLHVLICTFVFPLVQGWV